MRRPRLLCGRVEAHVRALQALGINSESYGKLLIPLSMEKLPLNMRPIDLPTSKKPFSVPPRKGKEFSSTSALINQSEESVTCTFCKQGYPSASCGVVTDIEAGRNLLKREGRCFICLRRNHLARKPAFAQEDITCKFA